MVWRRKRVYIFYNIILAFKIKILSRNEKQITIIHYKIRKYNGIYIFRNTYYLIEDVPMFSKIFHNLPVCGINVAIES